MQAMHILCQCFSFLSCFLSKLAWLVLDIDFPLQFPCWTKVSLCSKWGQKWFLCTPQMVIGFHNACCFLVSLAYAYIPLYKQWIWPEYSVLKTLNCINSNEYYKNINNPYAEIEWIPSTLILNAQENQLIIR